MSSENFIKICKFFVLKNFFIHIPMAHYFMKSKQLFKTKYD